MDGFNNLLVNVIGDVMVSAGVVAYLGAFTVRSNYYQGRIQGGGVMGVATPPNDFRKPRPPWSEI